MTLDMADFVVLVVLTFSRHPQNGLPAQKVTATLFNPPAATRDFCTQNQQCNHGNITSYLGRYWPDSLHSTSNPLSNELIQAEVAAVMDTFNHNHDVHTKHPPIIRRPTADLLQIL
jgi:hypothetical protein